MTVRYTTIYGDVIAENRGGVRSSYLTDSLGNTLALLDSTQTETDSFGYWPYGEVSSRTGSTPTSLCYGGARGYYSDMPQMYYVRARYLEPGIGRWLTSDPIGSQSGDFNIYRYARSSPVLLSDPTGLITPACIGAIACAGAAAIAAIIACANSPLGFIGCVECYCTQHPTVCLAIGGFCSAWLYACLPEFAPALGRIIGAIGAGLVSRPAQAGGGGAGGSNPCGNDDATRERCAIELAACQSFCAAYEDIIGCDYRWTNCCKEACSGRQMACLGYAQSKPWPCGILSSPEEVPWLLS